jgi:heptosyltransferase-2
MPSDRALLVTAGGGIGDTLLSGVVGRALRARFAAVDAVVLPAHAGLAARMPMFEQRLVLGERLPHQYDAAIVTWATLQTALLPFWARIPVRVGQASRLYSALFTRRVVVRSERGDRTTPWTQILLDYARTIGCDLDDPIPEFVPNDDDIRDADALLHVHGSGDAFYLLHPTRAQSVQHTRWPIEPFVSLARELARRDGIPIFVTGAAGDATIADAIAERAGRGVIAVAGATSIGAFGALAGRARAVIAVDSGPMHVAAAVGAPTVGIFALQSDEPDRWAPQGRRVAIVRPAYPCPPWHRKETCPDFACVRELDATRIVATLDGLLGAPAEP